MKILLGWDGFPHKENDVWVDPHGTWVQYEVENFADLAAYLREFSEIPRAADDDSKRTHHWYNPCVLKPESIEAHKRKKPDVDYLSPFICVDIDEQGFTIDILEDLFDKIEIIAHTTTSSKADWQCWRVVVKLDREYTGEEYEALWRYLQVLLQGQMDEPTKDYTRLSFAPAKWIGAHNEFHYLKGKPWIVDEIVAMAPPAPVIQTYEAVDLVTAPDGMPIITDRMVANNVTKTGRMYKILCAAATNYKAKGWELPLGDLYSDAQRVSDLINHKEIRKGELLEECQKAMNYIFSVVQTEVHSIEDITKSAMVWVKDHVKPYDKAKKDLYYHGLHNSPYVSLDALVRLRTDKNLYKFACSVMSVGVRYGRELKEDEAIRIMKDAEEELNKNDIRRI